jgi:hypothetical protein
VGISLDSSRIWWEKASFEDLRGVGGGGGHGGREVDWSSPCWILSQYPGVFVSGDNSYLSQICLIFVRSQESIKLTTFRPGQVPCFLLPLVSPYRRQETGDIRV